MDEYAEMAAEVAGLIHELGRPAELLRRVQTGDEFRPQISTEPLPIVAVQIDATAEARPGTDTVKDTRTLYISAEIVPDSADKVRLDGRTYEITKLQHVSPGGVSLLFELEISA